MRILFGVAIICFFVACSETKKPAIPVNAELQKLNEAIESGNDAKAYLNRGIYYLEQGLNVESLNDLNACIDIDSNNTDCYYQRAKLYYQSKKYKPALADLEHCYAENKEDIVLNKMMAQICLYLNKNKEAIGFSNNILKQDIHNAEAYFLKAYAFKGLNDTTKAISSFQTCLEQNPDLYKAHMQLALLYSGLKDPLALSYYDNALRIEPMALNPIYGKAMFYQRVNKYAEAKKIYRDIITSNPQYEKAYFNLGFLYLKQDSLSTAQRMFTMAIKIAPYYTDAYYNRGLCFEKANKLKEALKDYKQSLNFDPEHILANEAVQRINGSL